jgi:hypothetical protein
MNKKGKFYSNNKSIGFTKIKDIQQKSNQKQILSRSMERRKKVNPLPEPTTEKYPRVKVGQNKSKKVKLEKNQYISSTRNEKPTKRKEYANTISANEMLEENIQSPDDERKINYLRNSNNEERDEPDNNKPNIPKYNNNQQKIEPKKQKIKNNKNGNDDEEDYDDDDEEEEEKDNDLIYRTLYRSSNKNGDKIKEKDEKYKEKEKEKELNNQSVKIDKNLNNNFDIAMEQTDNLHYNNEDKKIYINAYNNKTKPHKRSIKRPKNKPKENKIDYNNINENENLYSPKTYEKRKIIENVVYDPERVIDLFIIDDDYDFKFLTKTKKKINRKNNKFREIIIENFEPNMPTKKEKFTGFIFIRKSKGKKMYTLELPDDFEQINEILKNESIMIKNQLIQMIPMNKIQALINQAQTQAQNEIKKSQNEKNLEKELEKEKELIKDKERQLTLLKNKNEELNNTMKKQMKQIAQYEKDMKNIKFNHEQLKDSFQALEQENKSLKSQVQAQRIRRKSIEMQIEEESNQRNLQEMKDRIQKYKNDLRKPSMAEEKEKEKHRKSALDPPCSQVLQEKEKEKTKNKSSIKDMIQAFENKKKEEKVIVKEKEKEKDNGEEKDKKVEEEENYEDDYNYDMYDERDPKAKKMKKAMARFRKKYKDIIIENKKSQKQKEKEEIGRASV